MNASHVAYFVSISYVHYTTCHSSFTSATMSDANLPQCLSTVRLHEVLSTLAITTSTLPSISSSSSKFFILQSFSGASVCPFSYTVYLTRSHDIQMLLDGTLGEREVRALETDRRLSGKYRGLRTCDGAFNAMLNVGMPRANQKDAIGTDAAPQKPPQLLYAEYLYCASGALCEKPLLEWGACVASLETQQKEIGHCAQTKRLLERCLRGKTEELLKTSQPQVFRPSATP